MPPLYTKVDCYLDSNPKIRKAGRAGREVFLFLLRRNRLLDTHGLLPALNVDPDYLADQLMMDRNDALHGVTACCNAKLITTSPENVVIIGWSDEWAREPMSNAERQAEYRRKQKEAKLLGDSSEPAVTERCNAKVTRNESNVRKEKRREEKNIYAASPDAEVKPASRKKPARALPSDWQPTPAHAALAGELGINLAAEAIRFRTDCEAKGRTYVSHDAAFSNWLRSPYQKATAAGNKPAAPTRRFEDHDAIAEQRMAEYEAAQRQAVAP